MSFLSCKSKKSDMFCSVDKICSGDSWRQPTFPLTGAFTQSLHNLFMSFTMCFGATETRSQLDGLLRSAAKIGYKQHHAWPCLCLIFANLFFVTRYEAAWLAMTFTTCWSYITMFSDSIITQGTWLHKHRNMPFPFTTTAFRCLEHQTLVLCKECTRWHIYLSCCKRMKLHNILLLDTTTLELEKYYIHNQKY